MPQVLVTAEKARPPAMPAEARRKAGAQAAESEADQDDGAGGEADLAFHAPGGAPGAVGVVEGVAVCGPGACAAGEGGGGDAVGGEGVAGVLGACAGGADDEDVAAPGGVVDVGQGPVEVVEGNVVGAGEVAGGVFAGGADVQDDQLVQVSAGLFGVEGAGRGHDERSFLVISDARLQALRYPGGYWWGVWWRGSVEGRGRGRVSGGRR
ncbi:hypothetical protein GCM10020254_87010 [Streptomyces goshikiensis]